MAIDENQTFMRPATVKVRSTSDQTKAYRVTLPECECLGFHFRGRCSHVLTAIAEYLPGVVTDKKHITKPSDVETARTELVDLVDGLAPGDLAKALQAVRKLHKK